MDALRATVNGSPRALPRVEFRRLQRLYGLHGLRDDGRAVTNQAVDNHVRSMRRKFEAALGGANPIRSKRACRCT